MKRNVWKRLASLALAAVMAAAMVPAAFAAETVPTGGTLTLTGNITYSNSAYNVSISAVLSASEEIAKVVDVNRADTDNLKKLRFTCTTSNPLISAFSETDLATSAASIETSEIFDLVSTSKSGNQVSVVYKLDESTIEDWVIKSAGEVASALQTPITVTFSDTLSMSQVWNCIGSANSVQTNASIVLTSADGNIPYYDETSATLASATCTTTISPVASGGSSSGSGGGTSKPTYSIESVDTANGDVKMSPTRASKGTVVTLTITPRSGYELAALSVIDEDGNEIKLTDKGDGKYTFVMPDGEVTVKASFAEIKEQPSELPFTDVESNSWYSDAVEYVYENDLMNGTSANTFSPFVTTSRAMILTILARYDGVDTSTGSTWYEAGAAWAMENGVSDGTNLEADLTREQLVTMLWRYLGSPAAEGDLSAYPDSAAVSDWAADAMIWAVNNQVITGNGVGALNPQGTATRAEMAMILMRVLSEK